MFKLINLTLKSITSSFVFLGKFFLAVLNGCFLSLCKLVEFFFYKLNFSMSFKINILYSALYFVLFYISYLVTSRSLITYLQNGNFSPEVLTIAQESILPAIMFVSQLIFFLLGMKLINKMLQPLKDMTDTVKNISGNDLVVRLDTNRAKDELKDLAITFNELMDRIQIFVEQQKQFVSDASHELRTPVAIIQGYTEMLARWGKDDPQVLEESILSLTQETTNMKDLLEKLLFLSRSDKNTLKVDLAEFNLSELCYEVIKETSFIDDEHELASKIEDSIMFVGDRGLIKELLRILIDNALKYTPEAGTITLTCVISKQNIILSVKDTGYGIPKEHIPHLFERFYRVDEARNKNTGGTGLGLAIAYQIIQNHHAQIFVNSTVNVGTEFVIFFKKD